jgi:Icc protein
VILPRKQVKAWIFGHSHVWKHEKQDDLHLVNLPATAWVFRPEVPAGWVDVSLQKRGAVFQLYTLQKDHPQNEQRLELKWR